MQFWVCAWSPRSCILRLFPGRCCDVVSYLLSPGAPRVLGVHCLFEVLPSWLCG